MPFHGLLDLDRGLDRLDRARELGQQRIAGCIDHPAAVARHQADNDVAIGFERLDGGCLVGRHQTGIADRVRAQDRGQLATAVAWVGHRLLQEETDRKLTLPGYREQTRLSSSLNSGNPDGGSHGWSGSHDGIAATNVSSWHKADIKRDRPNVGI